MAIKVNYNNVEERDMDTLFLEAFASDKGFLNLFLSKIEKLKDNNFEVLSVELSKSDNDGESDITVIIGNESKKIGLLIEDKINAIAMPNQCGRYSIRGNKGIKNNDYHDFFVFIVAPTKYYENNEEAKKYDHYVSYEECISYLENSDNNVAAVWIQQFAQAIEKTKKTSSTTFNPERNDFLRRYIEYQMENFPDGIEISSNPDTAGAGGWVNFKVPTDNSVLYHKAEKGQMDLTFFGRAEKEYLFDFLGEKIKSFGYEDVHPVKTGKSMAFRTNVPIINFDMPFRDCDKNDLNSCFIAAQKLTELAKLISYFSKICQ